MGRPQHPVETGHADQSQAYYEQAGDRTAAKRDGERGVDAATGSFGSAHVRAHGNVHANETGGAGKDCADGKTQRRFPIQENQNHDKQNHADDADGAILAI